MPPRKGESQLLAHQIRVFSLCPCVLSLTWYVIRGEPTSTSIRASKPCALRWVDMPDPPSPQRPPSITQRRVVDIDDPRAASILTDNGFGFVGQHMSLFLCCLV